MKSGVPRRHAIVTGGSSGIGKAVAKLLAAQGSNVSIIARTAANLEAAKAEIELMRIEPEQQIVAIAADVSRQAEVERAIQIAVAESGRPQILIASAGVAHAGYFSDTPVEVFEQMMAINYFGALYSARAVIPQMQEQRSGHLVFISSGAALMGIFGYGAYGPSKFAIRGLAEVLRCEMKPHNIKVSVVYPPDTATPQLEAENKTKPVETKRITRNAKTWTAEAVAQCIIRGMQRNHFVITPGLEMTLLSRLHSTLAPGINRYFDSIIARSHHS